MTLASTRPTPRAPWSALALCVAYAAPSGRPPAALLHAWAFQCATPREVQELEAAGRSIERLGEPGWSPARMDRAHRPGIPMAVWTARAGSLSEARHMISEAIVGFAALAAWGAGPLDGFRGELSLAAAPTGSGLLRAAEPALASFVERLELEAASSIGASRPRPLRT